MNLPGFCIHFSAFTRGHGIPVRLRQALQGYDYKYASGLTEHLKVKDMVTRAQPQVPDSAGSKALVQGEDVGLKTGVGFAYYLRKSPFYIPVGTSIHM